MSPSAFHHTFNCLHLVNVCHSTDFFSSHPLTPPHAVSTARPLHFLFHSIFLPSFPLASRLLPRTTRPLPIHLLPPSCLSSPFVTSLPPFPSHLLTPNCHIPSSSLFPPHLTPSSRPSNLSIQQFLSLSCHHSSHHVY